MRTGFSLRPQFLLAIVLALAVHVSAQQPQTSSAQSDEVVRVNTSLVQTDVTVFNKGGKFAEDLKREQFVLKVDGKPREVLFFERVKAGSHSEEAQLAAARGNSIVGNSGGVPIPLDRGRTIFFFVDDLHISAGNIVQVRDSLKRFIDRTMGQNDEAAILTTSGQVGFLQQLTDNKAVLRAAVERINTQFRSSVDAENPHMSEYQAMLIERNDRDVLDFFIDALVKEDPTLPRQVAGDMVRARAAGMLQQAQSITTTTLASLESCVTAMARLPGRKLVLFMSGGFLLDQKNSDSFDRIRRVTSAAAKAGVVIYSLDARGLVASMSDASAPIPFDPSGRLERASGGEQFAMQDGLNALARDTGGRAFFNTNALSAAVTTAVKESSVYYLLAWRPDSDEQRNPRFRRVEVSVVDHPDLVVRFRRGFGEVESPQSLAKKKTGKETAKPRTPAGELRAALESAYPTNALPISVAVNYLNAPQRGLVLAISVKIATDRLPLNAAGATQVGSIDLAEAVFDERGRPVSYFEDRLTVKVNSADPKAAPPNSVAYNHFSVIKPGLYQVRVAAREAKQGLAGSGFQWIEIPDLSSKALALSSLIVGERKLGAEDPPGVDSSKSADQSPLGQVRLNVDHRFARSSHLRFLTFVYNAFGAAPVISAMQPTDSTRSNGETLPANSVTPDLAVQVQVFRDNEPVITDPLHRIPVEGIADLSRLPYAAELNLAGLQPGRYALQVTVIDRLARTSASQRFSFEVD